MKWEQPGATATPAGALEVFIFTSSECSQCRIVREHVIPQLRATFGSAIRIQAHDVADGASYALLAEHERRVGSEELVTAKLFVGGRYLAGVDQMAARAVQVVKKALAERFGKGV